MKHFAAVLLVLGVGCLAACSRAAEPAFAIAIHGGAGGPRATPQAAEAALTAALTAARDELAGGGDALSAVEMVVRRLEDSPVFNAGRGSTFSSAGGHELDASIMDGRTRASGAVAGIRVAKNPVTVARLVMTRTKHRLLVGRGADAFARAAGAELAAADYFWTPATRAAWEELQAAGNTTPHRGPPAAGVPHSGDRAGRGHHGTVGCVVLDTHGNLAAATSTGGLRGKMPGRVGDSPLIGSGTWADNATCAVSCTGVGEQFIRSQVAYDIAARLAYGKGGLAAAVRHHLHEGQPTSRGGVIAVGADGTIVMDFNTKAMARAAADGSGRFEVVVEGEAR